MVVDSAYIEELSSVGSGAAVLTFTILLPTFEERNTPEVKGGKVTVRIRIRVWWKDEEQARSIQMWYFFPYRENKA